MAIFIEEINFSLFFLAIDITCLLFFVIRAIEYFAIKLDFLKNESKIFLIKFSLDLFVMHGRLVIILSILFGLKFRFSSFTIAQ